MLDWEDGEGGSDFRLDMGGDLIFGKGKEGCLDEIDRILVGMGRMYCIFA
jgi:hypothetical protein